MQLKTSLLVAFCAGLLLPACNSTYQAGSGYTSSSAHFSSPVQTGEIDKSHRSTIAPGLYEQRGMEISKITYFMADTLQKNVFYYLLPDAPTKADEANGGDPVKIVTMPRIAITSFVDTDTYEDAGYLGRALAEFFTNEMSQRAFEVTEFKVTGSVAVAKDGDFILSRNWKKIAKDTPVKYLLGGTLTRNENGVVVVARIIDMANRQVIASSTGFIAYNLLPACYRTAQKNCTFSGAPGYESEREKRLIKYYYDLYQKAQSQLNVVNKQQAAQAKASADATRAMTKAQVVSASGKPLGGVFLAPNAAQATPSSVGTPVNQSIPTASLDSKSNAYIDSNGQVKYATFGAGSSSNASTATAVSAANGGVQGYAYEDPRFKDNVVVGATSRGTYDKARLDSSGGSIFDDELDPVVYPSNTYMHNTLLIRDTADESTYKRISN